MFACKTGERLYSATVADLSGRDSLIFSRPLRTEQHDSQWLNGKHIIQSIPVNLHTIQSICVNLHTRDQPARHFLPVTKSEYLDVLLARSEYKPSTIFYM